MAKPASRTKPYTTYRQMSEELAEILDWFESPEVDIDEAVAKYEEALSLISKMEEYLKTAENKIKKISSKT